MITAEKRMCGIQCIEEFSVDLVNGVQFVEKPDGMRIKKGFRWEVDNCDCNWRRRTSERIILIIVAGDKCQKS